MSADQCLPFGHRELGLEVRAHEPESVSRTHLEGDIQKAASDFLGAPIEHISHLGKRLPLHNGIPAQKGKMPGKGLPNPGGKKGKKGC
jgi:hypothetical protein